MRNEELNNLALKAKFGCKDLLWAVKSYFHGRIHEMSNKYWHSIQSEERFEASCFSRIECAVRKFDPQKGDFYGLVLRKLNELLAQHRKRYSQRKCVLSLSNTLNDSDLDIESTLVDDLAVIDSQLIVKEEIALLAEGNLKRRFILKQWTYGENNDTNIARLLAQYCEGEVSTHIKYVQRFRARCRKALA